MDESWWTDREERNRRSHLLNGLAAAGQALSNEQCDAKFADGQPWCGTNLPIRFSATLLFWNGRLDARYGPGTLEDPSLDSPAIARLARVHPVLRVDCDHVRP